MIEIIDEKEKWNDYVSTFDQADVYHTFDYHDISTHSSKKILIKYAKNGVKIALPLLIRSIPNTEFYDATSVYGYSGPLHANLPDDFDNRFFITSLNDYLKENNIISVFSRLHPFIDKQHLILKDYGTIELKGPVVNIDIKNDIETQKTVYSRRLKGQINKLKKTCFIKKATTESDIKDFISIYHENMDRVNAKAAYYFDENYFRGLIESNSFKTETLLAIENNSGKTVGGSMFIYRDNIMHYHLSGTRSESLHLMPTKLLIDQMRISATEKGLSYFNLGGGLGGAEDSLLRFKSSFSKQYFDFYTWKVIVNQEEYKNLILSKDVPNNVTFFPLYRYNE